MTLSVENITFDSTDPDRLAEWWAGVVDGTVNPLAPGFFVTVSRPGGPGLAFQKVDDPTPGKNRVHVDFSAPDLEAEVTRQLQLFRELFGRDPTHLDSHQHRHRGEPLRSVLRNLGSRLGVPVRDLEPDVTYRGDFYGQTGRGEPLPAAIELAAFLRIVASLPDGVTELGCHPASEPETASSYAAERVAELYVLCDPRVREAVGAAGVELRSFA